MFQGINQLEFSKRFHSNDACYEYLVEHKSRYLLDMPLNKLLLFPLDIKVMICTRFNAVNLQPF